MICCLCLLSSLSLFQNTSFLHHHWVSFRTPTVLNCGCNKCQDEHFWGDGCSECSLEMICHLCLSWHMVCGCMWQKYTPMERGALAIYHFLVDVDGILEKFVTAAANGELGDATGGLNIFHHLVMTSWVGNSLHWTMPCRTLTATWGQWHTSTHGRQSRQQEALFVSVGKTVVAEPTSVYEQQSRELETLGWRMVRLQLTSLLLPINDK